MESIKIVQKNEANNFLSDALVLIQELNKANGKELSKEEKKELLIRLDEFSTSFIYFRESYDESKSKIHQLAEAMEDIRQISFVGEEAFQNAPNDQAGNEILMQMICDIMDKLENMNGLIEYATVEESQNRQLNGIKEIFIETKKDIQGSEIALRKITSNIEENTANLKDSFELVENQIKIFEKTAVEIKTLCDSIATNEETILKAFNAWEFRAGPEIERGFNDVIEKIENIKRDYELKKVSELKEIDETFDKCMGSIKEKSDSVIKNLEGLTEKAEGLFSGESVKQFLVYGGTAFSVLNFILLMVMFFVKK